MDNLEVHAATESYRGVTELFRTFGFEEHPDKVVRSLCLIR